MLPSNKIDPAETLDCDWVEECASEVLRSRPMFRSVQLSIPIFVFTEV